MERRGADVVDEFVYILPALRHGADAGGIGIDCNGIRRAE